MIVVGNDGHGEPFQVAGHLPACGLAAVHGPRAVVHGGGFDLRLADQLVRFGIVFFDGVRLRGLGGELIADLGLVAVLVFSGPAAKENAAVEVLAVADALKLQDEIAPRAFRL